MEQETIKSKKGDLMWNVLHKEVRMVGKKRAYFTVECSRCGFRVASQKGHIQRRKTCPGCSQAPSALKTDEHGNCLTICEIGTVEFIRDYQEQHGVSERAAVRQFVETVKAHLSADDPVVDALTDESVRATVRRQTGRKRETNKLGRTAPILKKSKRKKPEPQDDRVTDDFKEAFDRLVGAIQNERGVGWSAMSKETALQYANAIVNIITFGG